MSTGAAPEDGARRERSASGALLATGAAAAVLVLSEWLFFATKPSFLLTVPFSERLLALAAAVSLLGLAVTAALLPVVALYHAPGVSKIAPSLARVPAAALFAITALLLADGSAITLFRRGIRDVSATGGRVVLGAFCLGLLALGFRLASRLELLGAPKSRRRAVAAVLVAETAVLASVTLAGAHRSGPGDSGARHAVGRGYDIILLGADGLEASRTSLYGYERDNTPFLRQLAATSLVAERAYTNSGQTTGSITSLLTGKLPTTTRVHYPPDALRAIDQYEHLPGLLRRMGYRTFFAGVRSYADPLELRLLDAFDEVGGVEVAHPVLTHRIAAVTGDTAAHLVNVSAARIAERLAHVFLAIPMPHPKRQVSSGLAAREGDDDRLRALVRFLERPGGPKFAHVHFLGTHGPSFQPTRSVFSKLGAKAPLWDRDAQDDAILDFDDRVRELFGVLDRLGRRDRAIVVVYSDHGQLYRLDAPVPLVFVFPPGGPRGRIAGAVQLLDVAPTLLESLGETKPAWMQGTSFLSMETSPCRSILSARSAGDVEQTPAGGFRVVYELPWYSLGRLALISCSGTWWFDATVKPYSFESSASNESGCDPRCTPLRSEAARFFARALGRGGYPAAVKVTPVTWSEAIALASTVETRTFAGDPAPRPDAFADRVRRATTGDVPITRAEAAELAGRTRHPSQPMATAPGPLSFTDVGPARPHREWIGLLEKEVGGVACAPGRFCPDATIEPGELRRWLRMPALPDPNG